MREDTPAYLSTQTQPYCKRQGCALAGTDMSSGASLTAVCWTTGSRMTNGQEESSIDDNNPGLFTSSHWYVAVRGDGRRGYISEVYIAASDRSGKGLPDCQA